MKKKIVSSKEKPDRTGGFPVVCIGASAGGLEAIEQLLKNVPPDTRMAFVLIQHLDPTHKSILTDLIKRVTPLKVSEVTDGMQVEPGCAYVIPPNRDMAILHDSLQLLEPSAPRGMRLPIDHFLRSVALDQRENAVCIILSGTGTDGTLGLKAIKEKGGMVMVQEPKTAKYDGMPRSAIATGLVDFVLPPEKMAQILTSYTQRIFTSDSLQLPPPVPLRTEQLKKIYLLLRNQTGQDFTYYKTNTIQRRIERRMNVNQIERLNDYVRYLQQNPLEVETLFKELLIGVSSFFRDAEAFESLKTHVIPALFHNKPVDEPVRVWVPGCATGEEAYSLAILLRETMEALKQEYKLQVFATDIDTHAIETARGGVYPDSLATDVSAERLRRFFTKNEHSYQVTKTVRDTLVFAEQNLIKDPPFSRLDLISCRNLLIYLEGTLQKRLLPLFHYALRKDGHLFLGSSETIGEATDLFSVVDRKWKIFRRKGAILPRAAGVELSAPPFPLDINEPARTKHENLVPVPSSREITERMLLSNYTPACVLISEKGEGLFFHGDTGKYLKPPSGEASWNILGLAREGLRLDLSTALRRVATHEKPIRYENIRIQTNGDTHYINLTVRPVPMQPGQGTVMLVVFEDTQSAVETESVDATQLSSEPSLASDHRVVDVERELRSTREHLQTTIEELETSNEELKSTNEEMQSSNEELQSTNEELETSKEELQSVNEELVTVNTEHEMKLDELSKTYNDMANLLAATEIGTIFLDNKLCIQRFTPAATRLVKLIPGDIGRPLSDIATHITDENLATEANQVLDNLTPREMEVHTREGRWYLVRIRPYRTTENVIEGAVITFSDISDQKRVQTRLQNLPLLLEKMADSVFVTDIQGNIEYINPRFVEVTGFSPKEAVGRSMSIFEAGKLPPAILSEIWRTIKQGTTWSGMLDNRRGDGTPCRDRVAVYPMLNQQGQVSHFITIQTEMPDLDSVD